MPIDRRHWLAATAALVAAGGTAPLVARTDPDPDPEPDTRTSAVRRRRSYVDARFGQVHVTTTAPARVNATRPALCCLPFSPRSGRDFDTFAALLATNRRVHCPDVPGFGGSDAPPAPPTLEAYAAALHEALDALEPPRRRTPLDLFGQHTGAALSIELAIQRPERVRRLVLVGVPLFEDAERNELRAQFAKPRPYFEDPEFLCKAWQRDLAALDAGLDRETMLLRFTEIMRAGTRSWWGFNAVFNYPMREKLPQLRQPVLTIALNERLGAASREAAALIAQGRALDMTDLSGAALDFAAPRVAAAARNFYDAG